MISVLHSDFHRIIVPSFMAVRCWRITNRSIIFALSISSLLLLALAALLWVLISSSRSKPFQSLQYLIHEMLAKDLQFLINRLCFSQTVRFHNGTGADEPLFPPNQIWLCTSAVIDTVITICLIMHLKRMKRGFNTT